MPPRTRKGTRILGHGPWDTGRSAPPRVPANLPQSWRQVRRPRRVVGVDHGPLPAGLRYHGSPLLPKDVSTVFPEVATYHPSHPGIPRRYALGQDPNDVPNRVQIEYEQALKAVASIFTSGPFLLIAAAGILAYLLSRR